MRLLNTSALTFSDFADSTDVDYAILSHRWYATELTYQDMRGHIQQRASRSSSSSSSGTLTAKQQSSLEKIRKFCKIAKARGLQWAWVDTVCIDKRSSAELQESINSMFRWYEDARICLAYLRDVPRVLAARDLTQGDDDREANNNATYQRLRQSDWFQRGWTLQELLAPASVVFFNAEWEEIGTKASLNATLEAITGIPGSFLQGPFRAHPEPSVAKMMSWAAERQTTKVEDRAYSLMGLFKVNMPLLYGEGHKAFLRLQLEILQQSDDESIFAWSTSGGDFGSGVLASGLLAPWPEAFAQSSRIECFPQAQHRPAFRMTHKGLKVRMPVFRYSRLVGGMMDLCEPPQEADEAQLFDRMTLMLHCFVRQAGEETDGAALLHPLPTDELERPYIKLEYDGGEWRRVDAEVLRTSTTNAASPTAMAMPRIYVKQPFMHKMT